MQLKNLALAAPLVLLTAAAAAATTADVKTPDLVDVQAATCAQFAKAMALPSPPQSRRRSRRPSPFWRRTTWCWP